MFASVAHAMGTAGAGQAGGADALMQFVPLIAMLAIFYFLLIRPQQKRAKQHKAMLEALKKGDQVLTTGGLVGRVVDIDGDILSIDLGSTTVSLGRAYVVSVMDPREGREVGSFALPADMRSVDPGGRMSAFLHFMRGAFRAVWPHRGKQGPYA